MIVSPSKLLLATLGLTLLGVGLVGCQQAKLALQDPPSQVEPNRALPDRTYQTMEELGPEVLPGTEANLIMQGTVIPVTLSHETNGESLTLKLQSSGVLVAEERYRVIPGLFQFVGASGESYVPPITLAKFPQANRANWDWDGKVMLASQSYPAKATIASSPDHLNSAGGHFETMLVTVELEVSVGAKDPSRRTLKFWMAPGKGVVKRELGSNATREPRATTETN
ncbi:MAG: hypothetical protein MUC92_06460 [Fimbriimonadaceae bacterium]|nr:hypothetical protein [Fimbriimonadaceae bacterium]